MDRAEKKRLIIQGMINARGYGHPRYSCPDNERTARFAEQVLDSFTTHYAGDVYVAEQVPYKGFTPLSEADDKYFEAYKGGMRALCNIEKTLRGLPKEQPKATVEAPPPPDNSTDIARLEADLHETQRQLAETQAQQRDERERQHRRHRLDNAIASNFNDGTFTDDFSGITGASPDAATPALAGHQTAAISTTAMPEVAPDFLEAHQTRLTELQERLSERRAASQNTLKRAQSDREGALKEIELETANAKLEAARLSAQIQRQNPTGAQSDLNALLKFVLDDKD